jgi:hypothetical protein
MLKKFLASGGWELLPLLTMLFFLFVFVLALVRIARMHGSEAARLSSLPLEDDLQAPTQEAR